MVDTYRECSTTPYNTHSDSLLQKWNIPISHLDFEYIKQCNDSKELERIIRILRSGQEGHYPDLLKCAEERLSLVNPKSKVLLTPAPVLNKFTCDSEEWNNICKDIEDWQDEVSIIDGDLQESKNMKLKSNLPSVRKINEKENTKDDKPKINRIKSWDYAAWDKYDPEVELVREQLEEEQRKKDIIKKKAQAARDTQKKKSVCFDVTENLTETESMILSNREKDLGNECFKANDFEEAKKYYTSSIKLRPNAAAYNNRCIANIKLKLYKEALDDCEQVLRREPDNTKALFRKAQAFNGLKNYSNAFDTLDELIAIDPNNTSAQSLMNDIKNKITNYKPPQKQRLTIEEVDDDFNEHQFKNSEKPTSITKKVVVPIPSTSKFQGPSVKIMEVTEPVTDTIKSYDFRNLSKNKPVKKLQIKPKTNQGTPKIVEIDDSASSVTSTNQKAKITEIKDHTQSNYGSQKAKIVEIESDLNSNTKIIELENDSSSKVISEAQQSSNINSEVPKSSIVEIEDVSKTNINSEAPKLKEIKNDFKTDLNLNSIQGENSEFDCKKRDKTTNEMKIDMLSKKTIRIRTEHSCNLENTIPENNRPLPENIQSNSNIENSIYQITAPVFPEEYYENKFDRGDYIHRKNFNPVMIPPSNKKLDQENNSNANSARNNFDDNTVPPKPVKIDKGGSGEPHLHVEPTDLIQTPYEFTKAWQGIKDRNDLISRANVLRRVRPEHLQTGTKLDGPMFSSLLECLQLHFCTPSDADIVQEYLKEIVNVPRFDIIAMFMNDSDKVFVKNLISFLNQHGRHLSDHVIQAFDAKF